MRRIGDRLVVEESDFEAAVACFCTVEKTVAEDVGAAGLAWLC